MSLPAVAEIGRTTLSASTASTLAAGDVIRLDAHVDDPAQIFVGANRNFSDFPASPNRIRRR